MSNVSLNFDAYKSIYVKRILEMTVHILIWLSVLSISVIFKLNNDGQYTPVSGNLLNREIPKIDVRMYKDSQIVDYVSETLVSCLNFNFTNSNRKLTECSKRFENAALIELVKILNERNIVREINSGNILSTKLVAVPLMLDKPLSYEAASWSVFVRIELDIETFKQNSLKSSKGSYQKNLELHIVRAPSFVDGFAIKVAAVKNA